MNNLPEVDFGPSDAPMDLQLGELVGEDGDTHQQNDQQPAFVPVDSDAQQNVQEQHQIAVAERAPSLGEQGNGDASFQSAQQVSEPAAKDYEEEDAETDSDLDAPPPPEIAMAAAAAAVAPTNAAPRPPLPASKPGGSRRGGGRGVVSLKLLIEEGILQPGEDVFSVEYKSMTHTASLLPDGRIHTIVNGRESTFESPSAFSIYLKRLINPTRKADDGWKTVKYQGRLLEHYKHEFLRMHMGGLSGEGGSTASLEALEPRAAKRARTDYSGLGGGNAAAIVHVERPRRVRRAPPRFAAIGVDDEHALQPLESYGPGEAPFTVRVAPAAEVMMDYHAHLCMNEVIGILAGTWDPETKRIDIVRALPVRELPTEDDSINVEMDPEDQVARMEEISQAGLRVVGWYHSHPTFAAVPSTIDIYNQVLQQHAHREEGEVPAEPYVAAIVSPYDSSATTSVSKLTWFYVAHTPGAVPAEGQRPDEVGCVGKELPTEPFYEPAGSLENLTGLHREMERLAKVYAPDPDRANLEGPSQDGSLRIEKLVSSVQSRLPVSILGDAKIKAFADKIWVSTRAVWNIYGKPVAATAVLNQHAPMGVSTASGSAPVSAAVSQQGAAGEASGAGAAAGHDDDEPISDEEDTV